MNESKHLPRRFFEIPIDSCLALRTLDPNPLEGWIGMIYK